MPSAFFPALDRFGHGYLCSNNICVGLLLHTQNWVDVKELQLVPNTVARLLTGARYRIMSFSFLPMYFQTQFEVLARNYINGFEPRYLKDCLFPYVSPSHEFIADGPFTDTVYSWCKFVTGPFLLWHLVCEV